MNWILIGIMLTTFLVLISSRFHVKLKAISVQGAFLSVLYVFVRGHLFDIHTIVLFFITFVVKTLFVPVLIFRTVKDVSNKMEFKPFANQSLVLLAGATITILSFTSIKIFPLNADGFVSPLTIPAAISSVLIGFLILISKTKAPNQVLGFLILENGIFTFGMTIISDFPIMVEVGVLLDLLVCVFIMGIMIYHINKTFDHIDTRTLSALRDE